MNKETYIKMGFELYACMIKSSKYTQGIELMYPSNPIKSDNQPGVYVMTNVKGELLKIGETQNLTQRFHKGYRCISNITNNRIRQHIKDVESIWVYVLPMPIVTNKILGYKCETSYVKGLEHNLLKEYKNEHGNVPPLNVMIS